MRGDPMYAPFLNELIDALDELNPSIRTFTTS